MKKLLPILGSALLFTACNSVPDLKNDTAQNTQTTVLNDTTGMAAFNAWKAQNELATVTPVQQPQQAQVAPEKTRTIVKYVALLQALLLRNQLLHKVMQVHQSLPVMVVMVQQVRAPPKQQK
jgi:hypothetical protein